MLKTLNHAIYMYSTRSNNQGLKFWRLTPSRLKNIGIRKLEVVEKNVLPLIVTELNCKKLLLQRNNR